MHRRAPALVLLDVTITAEAPRQGSGMRDDSAFVEYVNADSARLLRLAYLMVGNLPDAEDLVQGCLARVSRRWSRIESPHAYAQQAIARAATDRWRHLRLRPKHEPLIGDHVDLTDPFGTVELRHTLLAGLRALPARQRAVLVLRYFEQLSEAETAAALGIAPGTVKTHSLRGLERLRELLTPTSEGTSA